jgi:hypothetical protein
MLRKLRRLGELPLREGLLLLQLLPAAGALLLISHLVPLPHLIAGLRRHAERPSVNWFPLFAHTCGVEQLTALADVAARHVQGAGCCLSRSLLLFWLFQIRRQPVELFIGVAKESRTLHSHAWVEREGQAIGDHPLAGQFVTILRFRGI